MLLIVSSKLTFDQGVSAEQDAKYKFNTFHANSLEILKLRKSSFEELNFQNISTRRYSVSALGSAPNTIGRLDQSQSRCN